MSERISDDELAYHRELVATLKQAQAAWQSWAAWMTRKYRLGPQDAISESGEITRSEPVGPREPVDQ